MDTQIHTSRISVCACVCVCVCVCERESERESERERESWRKEFLAAAYAHADK